MICQGAGYMGGAFLPRPPGAYSCKHCNAKPLMEQISPRRNQGRPLFRVLVSALLLIASGASILARRHPHFLLERPVEGAD